MKLHLLIILFALAFLSSCTSVHYNYLSTIVEYEGEKSKLVISSKIDEKLSSDNLGMMYLTFENQGDKYIRISDLKIDFNNIIANNNIYVVQGADLTAWQEGIQLKSLVDNHNRSMVYLGLIGLGAAAAIAGSASENDGLTAAGTTVLLATASSIEIDNYSAMNDYVMNPVVYPENHLFHSTIIVPPGLSARRWILFHSENVPDMPYIYQIYLEYTKHDEKKEKHRVQFAPYFYEDKPVWQRTNYYRVIGPQ
jgi:hypothetical protein